MANKRSQAPQDPETAYLEIRALAAGFFTALVKHGYLEEAQDFAEWFAATFDEEDVPWDSALSI